MHLSRVVISILLHWNALCKSAGLTVSTLYVNVNAKSADKHVKGQGTSSFQKSLVEISQGTIVFKKQMCANEAPTCAHGRKRQYEVSMWFSFGNLLQNKK